VTASDEGKRKTKRSVKKPSEPSAACGQIPNSTRQDSEQSKNKTGDETTQFRQSVFFLYSFCLSPFPRFDRVSKFGSRSAQDFSDLSALSRVDRPALFSRRRNNTRSYTGANTQSIDSNTERVYVTSRFGCIGSSNPLFPFFQFVLRFWLLCRVNSLKFSSATTLGSTNERTKVEQ
jgi:hypothetical protein